MEACISNEQKTRKERDDKSGMQVDGQSMLTTNKDIVHSYPIIEAVHLVPTYRPWVLVNRFKKKANIHS